MIRLSAHILTRQYTGAGLAGLIRRLGMIACPANTMARQIVLLAALLAGLHSPLVVAATPVIEIAIKDHLFYPAEIEIPANTKIKLLIRNLDPTPEEFESYQLNREKVISGHSKTVIFIGPLAPGIYPFFGEFFPKTAQGQVVVK